MRASKVPPKELRRVVIAASVGNIIEWYDFYIFGSLAAILAVKFFEKGHPVAAFLSTVAIFSVIEHWNEIIGPLIYLNSTDLFPVSIGLRYFLASTFTGDEPRDAILMAASLIVALPPLILFFVAQNYFVVGIATPGIMG